MNPKWIIGLAFLFIAGAVICNVIDMMGPLPSTADCDQHHTATCYMDDCINRFQAVGSVSGVFQNIWAIVSGVWLFLVAVGHMLIWDYSFLREGNMVIVRWIVFMPISVGLFWIIISTIVAPIVQVVASGVGSVGRWIGGLF